MIRMEDKTTKFNVRAKLPRATPADFKELQRLKLAHIASYGAGEGAYGQTLSKYLEFKVSRDWKQPSWQSIVTEVAEELHVDWTHLKELQRDHKRDEIAVIIKSVQDAVFNRYGFRPTSSTMRRGLGLWL